MRMLLPHSTDSLQASAKILTRLLAIFKSVNMRTKSIPQNPMPPQTPGLIPDAVPQHPLLDGRCEIGRGEYSIVLEADTVNGEERVYKLITDPTDYAFYTAADRPTGTHFPRLFADHGTIGRCRRGYPFHLIEVERLYPLPTASEAAELATRISSSYYEGCKLWRDFAEEMGRIALHHLTATPFGWTSTIQSSLQELSNFTQAYGALPDLLKADNLMMRKDGTLVFSDPVFMG